MPPTLADYEDRFGDVPTGDEPRVTKLLGDAWSLVQQITEQQLDYTTGSTVLIDVKPMGYKHALFLPERPVTNVTQVKDGTTTLNLSDVWWWEHGRIEKRYSTWLTEGPRAVSVTYDHGFNPLPAWLLSIGCSMAYRGQQSWTTDGIRSEAFVDAYTVSYSDARPGSQMGVTEAEYEQLCSLRAPVMTS